MRALRANSTLTLAATVLAAVLVVANISSLNVALPELSRELGASQSDVQWMVDIYAFFLASLLLPAGALGDKFGRILTWYDNEWGFANRLLDTSAYLSTL